MGIPREFTERTTYWHNLLSLNVERSTSWISWEKKFMTIPWRTSSISCTMRRSSETIEHFIWTVSRYTCLKWVFCITLWTMTDTQQVPQQPNTCDCGLYTIHFAHVFASKPGFYSNSIEVLWCWNIAEWRCWFTCYSKNPNVETIDIDAQQVQIEHDLVSIWESSNVGGLRMELKHLILAYGTIDEKLEAWLQGDIEKDRT